MNLVKTSTTAALSLSLVLVGSGLFNPAQAETIYLKNGSRYRGKILNQTPEAFSFQMPGDNGAVISIPKISVDVVPPPNPEITQLVGLMFPGAGQLYLGETGKAVLYFALTSVMAGVGYSLGSTSGNPVTASGIAVGAAALPWLIGSVDARRGAEDAARETRFNIQY